ncbi:MAG: undecaprenyldiphospho-muramoylpentapeptide beta-N-acetylglucosaminyltransferase [Candidatus Omnitrophica bacterium]|nr:undecaprenyldiphospho-muramoylpentapeptide beta-N-acetylglucosaminyltransferase [Candidatus Omnitrophota bacterium]
MTARHRPLKIIVATGESGGHIFPALSFLEALREKEKDLDALLVLPASCLKDKINLEAYRVEYLPICSIKPKLNRKNIGALFKFFKGTLMSFLLLAGFRPDLVVGFGGINSVPLLVFAWLFRIRTMIHEQNVHPGRANRLLMRFADRVAISFDQTRDFIRIDPDKLIFTGNPVRRELKRVEKNEALSFLGLEPDKFTLLVMGGSQGSRSINQGLLAAVSSIPQKDRFQIIHLSGREDYLKVRESYRGLNISAKVFDFLKPVHYAYSASDLVLSRSGAITVTEIMQFALPAILIPYPYAYQHQLNNARILEKKGCACIINDADLDKEILAEKLKGFLDDRQALSSMRSGYRGMKIEDSGVRLANAAIALARY